MAKKTPKTPTDLTPKKKATFLGHLAATSLVSASCQAAGISRPTAYDWRDRDAEFAEAWDNAKLTYLEELEVEADRRAIEGVEEPVYQGGILVGHKQRYSDTLLIFRAKALDPKYRDRVTQEHSGPGGGPIETTGLPANIASLPVKARKAIADIIRDAQDE